MSKSFVVAVCGHEDKLVHCIKKLRGKKIAIHDVFTPYPVHGLEDLLGYKRSRLPVAAFLFGTLGAILAITMQVWMAGIDWPMIIGGKPYLAIPDFVPVTFEFTVLLSAYGMAFTFFINCGLGPLKKTDVFDKRSTDDKHIIVIDDHNNYKEHEEFLLQEGAEEVYTKTK